MGLWEALFGGNKKPRPAERELERVAERASPPRVDPGTRPGVRSEFQGGTRPRGLANLTGGRRTMSVPEVTAIQLEAHIRRAKDEARRVLAGAAPIPPARLARLRKVASRLPPDQLQRLLLCFPACAPGPVGQLDAMLETAPREFLAALERDPGQALSLPAPWWSESQRALLGDLLQSLGEDLVSALASVPRHPLPLEVQALAAKAKGVPEASLEALARAVLALTPAELEVALGAAGK